MTIQQNIPESLKNILTLLKDKKASDIVLLDLSKLVSYTDHFLICSAENTVHLRTLADSVAALIKIPGVGGVKMEGTPTSSWVLVDGGDYVLHIFLSEARKFYKLEQLWEDAPALEVC